MLKVNFKIKNADNKYVFGINGCDHIVSKNYLWFLLKEYGRSQAGKLMPMTALSIKRYGLF